MNHSAVENFSPKLNMRLYRYWQRQSLNFLKWTRLKISGLEKISAKGPALLAANHLSWKDIPLLSAIIERPISFIATFWLFDKSLCHKYLDLYLGQITNRANIQKIIHRFNEFLAQFLVERVPILGSIPAKIEAGEFSLTDTAKKLFQQDKLMCVFPEGTLSSPPNLKQFKLGTAKILYDYYLEFKKSIPAYPVGIVGTHKILHPGMIIGLHVGAPLYIEDFLETSESRALINFARKLKSAVEELVRE